ncbi:uncharacterized protein LOC126378816 isoform X2 [Pectinophora gossypiella]|uniref:uncharacterized protein LOC126378816 isoform X2 n=1 Tax=Pectinophora gossypiella TaxID=13191 RepID=UPI00214F4D6C|nr:uncharacterized protein LOC126378816 isoform X2 [Pectinophora gossypiella]
MSKMQTTLRKASEKSKSKEKSEKIKDEPLTARKSSKGEEEKVKKSSYNATTPRSFIQKSSTVDIYGQKKKPVTQTTRAPKKVSGTTHTSQNVTPTKDFLKSSPSSISQISMRSAFDKIPKSTPKKSEARALTHSARKVSTTPRTAKDLRSNVTVNSPIAKRKLNMNLEQKSQKPEPKEVDKKNENKEKQNNKENAKDESVARQRTKTRTLDENEVKVLTSESLDNNAEMYQLTKFKLVAQPKAFYVELDGGDAKSNEKSSDEDVSYEDDFESYESDFDSYHSEPSDNDKSENYESPNENGNTDSHHTEKDEQSSNEHDPEKMLDSGNFELREQRSASRKPAVMEYILEDCEDKRASLTDEGFQDMSSSSAVSSMKTHVDVLDRPLFIDFSKSKENKRKRKVNEHLQQRAKDLLSMITLHEMSYSLYEMKPIPYDLYMATFGRSNYTQIAVQTYDDGIPEEVQTEDIINEHKWTQHPINFSKHDVYLYPESNTKKYGRKDEDYLTKFTFLINNNSDVDDNNQINLDKDYKENPLRIYFEQKDGVGSCEMLPYGSYKNKIENNDYNTGKLRKFLKKVERRVSSILSLNTGDKHLTDLAKNTKLPFSKGFVSFSPKTLEDEDLSFLKSMTITNLIFSDTKSNLIMSFHKKSSIIGNKSVICVWDVGVARRDPVKILVAIDNVVIGRFKGNVDGVLVAALEDGSIHLWDLSEEPTWRSDVASEEKPANLVEINSDRLTQTERDRQWNVENSNVGREQLCIQNALQAGAYTSSAGNMATGDVTDCIVGLEFVGDAHAPHGQDGGRKIVGQVCSLQQKGILCIWSIVQEKTKNIDMGKAYWSKMKLERTQTIMLLDHIDIPTKHLRENENIIDFNLTAAKRRLSSRKSEKSLMKIVSRLKSNSSEFDISRPASAASFNKVLSIEKTDQQSWERGIVCCHLKIMKVDKKEYYLVAKNCGEVLCCTRIAGAVKVNTFSVTTDTSTVTCLDVSSHGLPYFLATTDSGTVNLCSLLDSRVLLTLDCRNCPPNDSTERCQSDHKGRFISSAKAHTSANKNDVKLDSKALLSPEGEIQVHRLSNDNHNDIYVELFKLYATLL